MFAFHLSVQGIFFGNSRIHNDMIIVFVSIKQLQAKQGQMQSFQTRSMTTLPIIDFGGYGLHIKNETKINPDTLKTLGREFKDVFTNVEFCYLKNHGIDEELVDIFKQVSLGFFEQSDEEKRKYCGSNLLSGYIPNFIQSLNSERPMIFESRLVTARQILALSFGRRYRICSRQR